MSQAPSMPMYWDAYLADTTHLTTEEHGAYMLLLGAMWRRNGWVPDDDKDNARILSLSTAKWKRIKARISPFLIFENGQISQKNLLKTWQKTQEKIAKNKENGAKGGRVKSKENNDLDQANGSNSLKPNQSIPEPEPEPYKYIFDSKKWFSEADETTLQAMHPNIDVAAKLKQESFRKWSFEADPAMPMNAAKNWFQKQEREREGNEKLAEIIQINQPANPSKRLQQSRMTQ